MDPGALMFRTGGLLYGGGTDCVLGWVVLYLCKAESPSGTGGTYGRQTKLRSNGKYGQPKDRAVCTYVGLDVHVEVCVSVRGSPFLMWGTRCLSSSAPRRLGPHP